MKPRQKLAHMHAAEVYARLSYCERRKVGCVIIKDDRIISIGYNGTLPGHCNTCEDENGRTYDHVIHAEDNALRKLHRDGESGAGATLFVTTAPCPACARKIIASDIHHVVYKDLYRTDEGIQLLRNHNITVEQLS